MLKKWVVSSIFGAGLLLFQAVDANPLAPQTPVRFTNTTVITAPVVSKNSSGFMISYANLDGDTYPSSPQATVFSSDGISWSTPVLTGVSANSPVSVAGLADKFLIAFKATSTSHKPTSIYSTNNGDTWSSPLEINDNPIVSNPIAICSSTDGFMSTWWDLDLGNADSSFSSDGTSWNGSSQVTNSGRVNSAVLVAHTTAGFMATWAETDNNAYASYSNDNGNSWSTPVQLNGAANVYTDVWVSGNASEFMAVWVSDTLIAYSSFSTDNGATWSTPVAIATDIMNGDVTTISDIAISGCLGGFVASWLGTDANVYASFSKDLSASWSRPVQLTNNAPGADAGLDSTRGFASVCAVDDYCVFSWMDSGGGGYACYCTIDPNATDDDNYDLYDFSRITPIYDVGLSDAQANLTESGLIKSTLEPIG